MGVVALVRSEPVVKVWYSPPLSFVKRWLVPALAMIILVVAASSNSSNFQLAKSGVLSSYFDAKSHLVLADVSSSTGDYILAEDEFTLALDLLESPNRDDVLGYTTDIDVTRNNVFPEEVVRDKINTLEKKLDETNSRDLYLGLAVLNWQIYEDRQANFYLSSAKKLDPNDDLVELVESLLENKQ